VAWLPFESKVRRWGVFHFRVLPSNSDMKAWSREFVLASTTRFPSEETLIPPVAPAPVVTNWLIGDQLPLSFFGGHGVRYMSKGRRCGRVIQGGEFMTRWATFSHYMG
jgi:hypothetical protein